jgi:hypothetical protein
MTKKSDAENQRDEPAARLCIHDLQDGKIVGVNAFGTKGAEGINFAIAAKDLRFFLETLFEGRNDQNNAFMRVFSARCDNKADLIIIVPDNGSKPIYALIDSNRRGKNDGLVLDVGRTGRWSVSFWDKNLDETFPLKAIHATGKLFPTSYVDRCPQGTRPVREFRCQ